MVGTAGNLSARCDDGSFWITASGRMKGALSETDFIRVGMDGSVQEQLNEGDKPSAETSIHQTIYELYPDAKACYHVHSVEANVVSTLTKDPNITLPNLEMIKGLGVWDKDPNVTIPVFENEPYVPDIAAAIERRLKAQAPRVGVLLIRNHGVTVWSDSTSGAFNAIELIEFIFRYMVLSRQTTTP